MIITDNNNLSKNEDIEQFLNLNLKLLSCLGIKIYLSGSQVIKKRKLLEKIPTLITIGFQVYYAITQVLLIMEAMQNHQYMIATEVGSYLFSNMMISSKWISYTRIKRKFFIRVNINIKFKGCRLLIAMTEVDSLLKELASVWRQYVPGHKIQNKILHKANRARFFCKIFIVFTIGGIFIYCLPVLVHFASLYKHRNTANYTRDYKRIFRVKYPFEIKSFATYFFVILIEEYVVIGTALFWMCGDTLFAQLTTHASLQFEILRNDIESLMNEQIVDYAFRKNFTILVERHKHLLRICNRIEHIYSFIIFMTMVLSGLNICFNIFDMIELINDGDYKAAALHSVLAIDTLGGMVFYCVFAETLTEQTGAIGDAIYNSNWTDKDYKLSIYFQMVIMKSQNPFYCTAYGYFPIGHTRLTRILNAALSYFMMLRTTA